MHVTAENFNNFLFLQVDRQILLDDNFFTILVSVSLLGRENDDDAIRADSE